MKHGFQTTLADRVEISGLGVHSAAPARIILHPSDPDSGISFLRTGLPGGRERLVEAKWSNIRQTSLCTVIGDTTGATIATVEHLMAALSGLRIDNCMIEIDGPETPIMDGSAAQFVEAIDSVGLVTQSRRRRYLKIVRPVYAENGRARAELRPAASGFRIDVSIDFDALVIGRQRRAFDIEPQTFRKELARARTFGFMHEVESMRSHGLGLGGNLENAVVIDDEYVLNPGGLRFPDEFVRHKILDAIGDLYIVGHPLIAAFSGFKSGHALNNALLRKLLETPSAWEFVSFSEVADAPSSFHRLPVTA